VNLALPQRWLALIANRRAPEGDGERRVVRILQATLTALAGRGVSAITTWIAIPLTLGYLGIEKNGIWLTLATFLALLNVADLGLGYSVMNALSSTYAHDDKERARVVASSAFVMLCGVAIVIAAAGIPVIQAMNWPVLLGAPSLTQTEIATALTCAFLVFIVNLPLSALPKMLAAYQEGARGSFVTLCGSVAGFLGLLTAIHYQLDLPGLILGMHGVTVAVWVVASAWLFGWHKPFLRPALRFVRWDVVRSLWSQGWKFFVLQLTGAFALQSDVIIVSWRLGADQVTAFNNAQKLFVLALMVQALASPFVWTAFGEAQARNDVGWMRRALRRGTWVSLALGASIAVPLIFIAQPFIAWWIDGNDQAIPSMSVIIWHAAWVLVFSILQMGVVVLNAHGRLTLQMICGGISALVNIGLSIYWADHYGPSGVIAASVAATVVFTLGPVWWEVSRVLWKPKESSTTAD
jgi:O-antigen/teichoic acid export membrane protein